MTATAQSELPQAVDDFFAKDIPEPFQILGLRLLPLSIGRYRRMARHGIGFVSESNSRAGGADLLLGVIICSMTCKEFDQLASSYLLPKMVAGWLREINAAPPWYLRGKWAYFLSNTYIGKSWRKNHSFDLVAKARLFKKYIEEAQVIPKFLYHPNCNGGTSVSHWTHNIEVVLMGELNWSHDDINELPLSKAIADFYKHMENQGLITILTEFDYAQIHANDLAFQKAFEQHGL